MPALPRILTAAVLLVAFSACNGGDSPAKLASCSSASSTLCLASCNLGCSTLGCSLTEIAQNQPIQLNFSRAVDPTSVNNASVSIQTASGRAPRGRLHVDGSTILFVPEIAVIAGTPVFGFQPGEAYILHLPGGDGEAQAVRGTNGDPLASPLTCQLSASRGVVDLDGQPPAATLLSPSTTTNIPRDAALILEFSEIIDATPFVGATSQNGPILYSVRSTVDQQCNLSGSGVGLPGVPQVIIDPVTQRSQVILQPTTLLPYGSCVEIEITNRVTDLAGTPAEPALIRLLVTDIPAVERTYDETFGTDDQLDADVSSGTWGGGVATPGQIGGDGIHGDFDVTIGRSLGGNVWEWSTDLQLIPSSHTFPGIDITVTDGVFRFSQFNLPAGATLKFVGSNPPRLFVRGRATIDGVIDLSAVPMPAYRPTGVTVGQPGGVGAVAAGSGGAGADQGDGLAALPEFAGRDGDDVQLVAGHAYGGGPPTGRQLGTGGLGSVQYPEDGLDGSVTFTGFPFNISGQAAAGGGGGGFDTAGANGRVVLTSCTPCSGPGGIGGAAFDVLPVVPVPPPGTRLDHLLVGGSGGGGGGSHAVLSSASAIEWQPGAGGAGGGGPVGLRVGSDLSMGAAAVIRTRGGNGGRNTLVPLPAPGGGGSGGSCILQVGESVSLGGLIDVRGGGGGQTDSFAFQLDTRGGDGAPGFLLLETGTSAPPVSLLGNTMPTATARNVAALTESDIVVGSRSKWYFTGEVFAPRLIRYEIEAVEDGRDVIYSDDSAVGILAVGTPVQLWVQGAKTDPLTGQIDPASVVGWRTHVGRAAGQTSLFDDSPTAYRFQLLFDRSTVADIAVMRVTLVYTIGTL